MSDTKLDFSLELNIALKHVKKEVEDPDLVTQPCEEQDSQVPMIKRERIDEDESDLNTQQTGNCYSETDMTQPCEEQSVEVSVIKNKLEEKSDLFTKHSENCVSENSSDVNLGHEGRGLQYGPARKMDQHDSRETTLSCQNLNIKNCLVRSLCYFNFIGAKKMAEQLKRGKWSLDQLSNAIAAYKNGDFGLNECARKYCVPKATLKRHIDCSNKYANGDKKQLGRGTVLPDDVEAELLKYIVTLESMFFGVTRKELMRLAYEVAEKNKIPHVFNHDLKSATKTWYMKFCQRHPEISLRQPESTSIARASGFNKEAMARYFRLLEDIIDENKLTAMRIYNMDESSVSVVQKRCQKILGLKGKRQIGSIASAERGTNTTVVCCNNAAGLYVPPLIIFKRKKMPAELADGAPPGSVVTCNDSGWMDSNIFTRWLNHFIQFVKPTKENKVLLILDGHNTHTKNLEAIEMARNNNVIMLSIPPHTTHKAQPLDKTFFKPLQSYYNEAVERWLRTHPGRAVTSFQVCSLFNEAYVKAATMSTAINGFAQCGIWPCTMDVFAEHEFQPICPNISQDSIAQNSPVPGSSSEHTACNTISPSVKEPNARSMLEPSLRNQSEEHTSLSISNACNLTVSSVVNTLSPQWITFTTKGDGRCFFRSIAVGLEPQLQIERCNGTFSNAKLMLQETCLADSLRSQVIQYCLKEYERFAEVLTGDALVADMPPRYQFRSLLDRLEAMSETNCMVGEFEVSRTSEMIKRTIKVVDNRSGNVVTYGENFTELPPLYILYTSIGSDSGHYDALKKAPLNEARVEPFSPVKGLTLPVMSPVLKKSNKKRKAEILTSSPYKQSLKQKRSDGPKTAPEAKKKSRKTLKLVKAKKMKDKADESWYCFMCEENIRENMICCTACHRWAHVECAGVENDCFLCETCQSETND